MSLMDDRRAMAALWIVTGVLTLIYGGFLFVSIIEEPIGALMGIGGMMMGALLAACINLTRRPSDRATPSRNRVLEGMAERLESLELERSRVMELEERLDFAERLLARERAGGQLEGRSS
jgi:hypothetical protein